MAKMGIEHYKKILNKISKLKREKVEENIFSLGARRHYENPISDLLSFFINPSNEHCFQDLFLSSLIRCASQFDPTISNIDIFSFINSNREVITPNGKKLDIVVEGENWTISIENKIRANLNNPLEEYELFITKEYQNKKNYFVILSPKNFKAPANWIVITYKDYIKSIQTFIGNYIFNQNIKQETKWIIFLREFLLNLIKEVGEQEMDKEKLDFVKRNIGEINELINMRDDFFFYISQRCREILNELKPEIEVTNQIQNWKVGYAIRSFMSDYWNKGTNLVFVVMNDGSYKVRIYFYGINEDEKTINSLKNIFKDFKYWIEGSIHCFGKENIQNFEDCFIIFKEAAKKVNSFYT